MGRLGRRALVGGLILLAALLVLLTGCVFQPTPTTVDAPPNQLWIEWENRTTETYAVTILGDGAQSPAYGEVEACSAHGMGVNVDEPFTIGIRAWDDDANVVGRPVADEDAWRASGRQLLLVITDGGQETLGQWTEQRASVRGFCP